MAELNSNIIGLITDFGIKGSHYVASMKGLILKVNPRVKIIDISHSITQFSIIEANYIVNTIYRNFPEGTIFIVVVDPGVGSSREILLIKTKSNYYFIGPNNGVFSNLLAENDIEECINIKNDKYFNKPVSNTFHGRDIMAPISAFITKGINLNSFGPKFDLNNFKKIQLEYEIIEKNKKIKCIIQYVDNFGNGVTNILLENNKIKNSSIVIEEGQIIQFELNNRNYKAEFTTHFEAVSDKKILLLKGSTNFLEISINLGNAAKQLGFNVGDKLVFTL
ncbi:MAG: S-adenosyl-l-methionine hydroxide adenosyltransferase family protein [Promethearchaeota archaeon]